MNKYSAVIESIFSIFASDEWVNRGVKTFPSNFTPKDAGSEYIRVAVLPRGIGINLVSSSGVLIVDIFTSANEGPMPSASIADKLDTYLVGQSIVVGRDRTQFFQSSFVPGQIETVDPTLCKSTYTIPFSYFGASQ